MSNPSLDIKLTDAELLRVPASDRISGFLPRGSQASRLGDVIKRQNNLTGRGQRIYLIKSGEKLNSHRLFLSAVLIGIREKKEGLPHVANTAGVRGSWEKLFRNVSEGLFRLAQGCGRDRNDHEKKINPEFKKHLFTSGSNKDKE